jgi:glucose-fructose oxidoreductase
MGSWVWPFARKDMEVYGATGYAITVGPDKMRVRLPGEKEEEPLATPPALSDDESNSLSYLAAVLNGKVKDQGDLTALDTNVIVMQILDAARESVKTGRTIKLQKLSD